MSEPGLASMLAWFSNLQPQLYVHCLSTDYYSLVVFSYLRDIHLQNYQNRFYDKKNYLNLQLISFLKSLTAVCCKTVKGSKD